MAITWTPTITPVSVGGKIVNISAVAVDDTDPGNPVTVRVDKAPFGTQAQQIAAANVLNTRYLAKTGKATAIATWLAGKEAAMKTYLEGL